MPITQCYGKNNTVFFLSGKIFGIHANYIIAEVEFFEGEDPEEALDDEKQQEQQEVYCLTVMCHVGFQPMSTSQQ